MHFWVRKIPQIYYYIRVLFNIFQKLMNHSNFTFNNINSNIKEIIRNYQKSSLPKSIWQLSSNLIAYILLWAAMYLSLDISYWLTLLLAVPAAFMVVRIFIIQHDCGHGSFFKSRDANDLWGVICSLFTLTPYHYWKQGHSIHHASAGNLEARGIGDIYTMTVSEYLSSSKWERFKYRIYRNPVVLFLVIPTILFVILYRFPIARSKSLKPTYPSIYYTNLILGGIFVLTGLTLGFTEVLMIQLPVTFISSTAGVWLFYVQHQFEETYWANDEAWNFTLSALQGSSYFKLPKILQWATGNIGYHHIHHLSPKIPNYHLEKCHKENPVFQQAVTLTLLTSFKTMFLSLWEENQKKLVSFRYLKKFRANHEGGI